MSEEAPRVVPVEIPENPARAYDVRIGRGVLSALQERCRDRHAGVLVADSGVPDALVHEAARAMAEAGVTVTTHRFESPIERTKVLASVEAIARTLAGAGLDRTTGIVVALGGGIVGDTAGYAAASYQRGVPIIQCPTTLLAMVDASVGGKTGVNLESPGGLLKNYLGAFHQPIGVVVDTRALDSLSDRHLRAGLAECVKHACLSGGFGDPELMAWTEANADRLLAREPAAMVELIERNVRVKAAVVRDDEQERAASGGRALLNLGHTFAHAIEPIPTLSPDGDPANAPLHHGEAVALGVIAAAATAHAMDPAPDRAALLDRLTALFARLGLPTRVTGLPANEQLAPKLSLDKKARAGVTRLVLPRPDGTCETQTNPPPGAICVGLDAIRAV